MRRRKKPGALEKYLAFENFIITGEDDKVIAEKIYGFAGNQSLEIELGSGCSGFIITHAMRNPEKMYIAIEFKEELLLKAVKNCEELGLKNIRFLRYRIEELPLVFEKLSADKIYLNFSDPWPKKRHEKRRLTHPKFLSLYKQILNNNGVIEFKTDNLPMFEYSLEMFEESGFIIQEKSYDLHADKAEVIMSEYEQKYSSQGQKINFVKLVYKI